MKTTTTFKAMMAMAFAMFAMTANATPKNTTWRNTNTTVRIEVRNDNRNHRRYDTHWNTCRHNHLDRYGNRYFCHTCGAEMVWKAEKHNGGHYEVIAPNAKNNNNYGGRNNNHGGNPGNKNNKNHR